MQHYYASQLSPTQQQARPNMGFYPNQMVMNHPQNSHIPQGYYYPSGPYPNQGQAMPNHMVAAQYLSTTNTAHADPRIVPPINGVDQSNVNVSPNHKLGDLMSLVHHVCKEANGLESLFLISKSNCAFANFKDETTCVTAQQKLHDSKFQSVRLPTVVEASTEAAAPEAAETKPATSVDAAPQKDKFFVLKSLTVEDLELSVRTGIWATQSHNEETLNGAFQSVDNVYLVFSANKSGEYFGYARMTSSINEDPAAAIEFAPKAQSANDTDLPKAIPTEATDYAPKGRIIDDSARGTIFWEAEREDGESGDEEEEQSDVSSRKSWNQEGDGTTNKAWGKPFKLEWLSTARLPFYRTRGLRNPWNSNREVKIARDGTELEPSVGRRLIGLFNRVQSPPNPGAVPAAMRPGMAMIAGYPPMRPQFQQ
ncbi:hypothetical protein Brms1b_004532 [Colletotrichum noveboracense]|nr:hypothetical protein CBS470a_007002 [Colletotrichum nupharicola]KAJ0318147.1 hypothetical protein Brms1b_004532 [Colletotrichum noveboracense]